MICITAPPPKKKKKKKKDMKKIIAVTIQQEAYTIPWLELEILYPFPGNLLTHRQGPPHQRLRSLHQVVQEKPALCAATQYRQVNCDEKAQQCNVWTAMVIREIFIIMSKMSKKYKCICYVVAYMRTSNLDFLKGWYYTVL